MYILVSDMQYMTLNNGFFLFSVESKCECLVSLQREGTLGRVLLKAAEAERGPGQKGQTVEKTRKRWQLCHTSSAVIQDIVCSALGCGNVDILKEGTKERPYLNR